MPVSAREAATLLRRQERSRIEAERAHAERTRDSVLASLRAELRPGERAWLIGSLVWGGFGAHSDVDVVLSGVSVERSLVIEITLAKLTAAPVDVLALGDLPAAFRERVEREGLTAP